MSVIDQINAVTEWYPSLSVISGEDGYTLTGIVAMAKTYNDVPLYDDYHLKIVVPADFPTHMPSVFDTNNDVPEEFMHFLNDGSFCLGAYCDLRSFLDAHPSLVSFIDEIVMSYLYSASYYRVYGTFPYGARSHGTEGIIEAYRERYKTDNDLLLTRLLLRLIGKTPYRGHSPCPCGSGKHLRNCHGGLLIKDIQSVYRDYFQNDAYEILYFFNQEKAKRGKKK